MGQNEGSCVVSADHLQVVTHIVAFEGFYLISPFMDWSKAFDTLHMWLKQKAQTCLYHTEGI